jgi:hypothetical protein
MSRPEHPESSSDDNLIALLYRFRSKTCAIPRDRTSSVLPLYRWHSRIKVDYRQADGELVVAILRRTNLCSVSVLVHCLRPRSSPLGSGYMELYIKITTLHWGCLEIFGVVTSPSVAFGDASTPSSVYARSLGRIEYDQFSAHNTATDETESECRVWLLMRQLFKTDHTGWRTGTLLVGRCQCSWSASRSTYDCYTAPS